MRYSKSKKITIAIVSVVFVIFIAFIIFKGINDSKKISDNSSDKTNTKVTANVGIFTKIKKKFTKSSSKTEIKETKEENKVVNKVVKKEIKEEKPVESLEGNYIITELKIGDKKYSKDEIKKLRDGGYSLTLDIKSDGSAELAVLYISKTLFYDNDKFSDGQNEYSYTKSRNKIKLKIDNSEMTFKKE